MLINLREYHRPTKIEEARRLLQGGGGRLHLLAGGMRLVGSGDPAVEGVIDLGRLDLGGIDSINGGIRIGAMATLQQLVDSPLVKAYAGGVFCQAARSRTVSKMIRNVATVGGELSADEPFSALAAAVLALDAQIRIYDSNERNISAAEFYSGRKELLSRAAIITELVLPERDTHCGSDLERLATLPSSVPILCVATSLRKEGEQASQIRIALSGAFASPARLPEIEQTLDGARFNETTLQSLPETVPPLLDPPSDLRGTSEYRRQVAPILIRRSLLRAWRGAGGKA